MDWKDVIAKLRLVDVSPEVKGDQVGGINVKVENNTYNIHLHGGVGLGGMEAIKLTPEFEREVKVEAERRLVNLGISPDLLSEIAVTEIANATTAISAMHMMIKGGEKLNIGENVTVKISPEPEADE